MSQNQIDTLPLTDTDIDTLRPYISQMSSENLAKLKHCGIHLSRHDIVEEVHRTGKITQEIN